MRLKGFLLLVCLAGALAPVVSAQDYGAPLEGYLQLSSNYGKLRGTRFHTGVDFRTGGVEGRNVMAVEDGYIFRIGIAPWGYGKAVYIAHPDGRQTVYAHLSEFTPEVEAFVRAERYARRTNAVDLWPARGRFTVLRGETIGLSGNTGNSYGPHLHFEIRNASDSRTLNPVSRGVYEIKDDMPPRIYNVYYYTVDTLSGVPVHTLAGKSAAVELTGTGVGTGDAQSPGDGVNGHRYKLAGPMRLPSKGYFVVETMDRKDDMPSSSMAAYRVTMKVDGRPWFEYLMDGFTFGQNPYAKSVSAYALSRTNKNDFFRLAVQNQGAMPFYRNVVARGVVNPESLTGQMPGGAFDVEIEVEDDSRNTSAIEFEAVWAPELYSPTVEVPLGCEAVDFRRDYVCTTDALTVTIPARALYESLFYTQKLLDVQPTLTPAQASYVLTDFYKVHSEDVPLNAPVTLEFSVPVPVELQDKVVVARMGANGRLSASAAEYDNGVVRGKVTAFGLWCAAADDTAPTITPSFRSGADLSGAKSVSFTIKDNFSGVASYEAEVDGRWAILEHNVVKGVLTHNFDDEHFGRGEHTITLILRDGAGNVGKYTGKYVR